jgi:dTDP-4-amino-4,6-dideoxygalactose transaminase
MAVYKIPFNKPNFTGNEVKYIKDAIARGQISGDGYYSKKCQDILQSILSVNKVLMTTSCTHALEMTALLLDVKDGDEVIIPSFTFVSTVNAFVLRGAMPIFADIRTDTLNIDEKKLEKLITRRTKAVVVVHYAGVGCEMDEVLAICRYHNLPVVEDNAHGLMGKYKNQNLGTFGCMATQSFHETKNFTCGEGGALLVNDEAYFQRAEIIREKGTNRSRFFRGEVDKYTWVDIGSSYPPSDLLGAYLYAQLERYHEIQEKRMEIWNYYYDNLRDWTETNGVGLPFIPSYCQQPFHMFYLMMPSLKKRQSLIEFLKSKGILAVFHYLPLHLSEMGQKFGGKLGDCPVTEDISDCILRLPFYNSITREEHEEVIAAVRSFRI